MINPFIWSRLQRPGQPVPFLFGDFRREDTVQLPSTVEALPHATTAAPAQRQISQADALIDLMDIVKSMLGPQVRLLRKLL